MSRKCEQEKLKSLPPLPATSALAHANSILAAARGRLTAAQQIELLLDPLQSQSLGVRSMALQVEPNAGAVSPRSNRGAFPH